MVDIVSPSVRSRMMSGIKGKNTRPELIIRKALHARGFRYRLHAANIPGKPDIVLARYHAVIFVHGCFWHGHDCPLFRLPSTRTEFWQVKITRNRIRDAEVSEKVTQQGWRILSIWECSIKGRTKLGVDTVVELAISWLTGNMAVGEIRGSKL